MNVRLPAIRLAAPDRRKMMKLLALPLLLGAVAVAPSFAADAYPTKTVKIVVNYPPGGPVDIIARLAADKMQKTLKQSVIVENTSGAGGNIGASSVARSAPDGHTILFSIDAPFTMNPWLYRSMPFKPDQLKPVIMMGSSGTTLAVHPSTGVNSLKELVEKGKKEPITFSSAGNASPGHVAAEMLSEVSGIQVNHIPYRGNAPAMIAVVSGEVQAGILAITTMLPHIKEGKVKSLAVASSQRSKLLPDVPTTAELGYPGVVLDFLLVAMVPAKTPDAIVDTLHKAISSAVSQPDVQERLSGLDIATSNLSPAQTADLLKTTGQRYAKVIKETGMKAD